MKKTCKPTQKLPVNPPCQPGTYLANCPELRRQYNQYHSRNNPPHPGKYNCLVSVSGIKPFLELRMLPLGYQGTFIVFPYHDELEIQKSSFLEFDRFGPKISIGSLPKKRRKS
jgi:hypothetical protein